MTRRRLRKAPVHIAQQQKVHDRTSAIVPLNAKIFVDEVDDAYGEQTFAAYDRGELYASRPKVTVVRSTRDDPLAALKAQGVIDQVQFDAGLIWQAHYMRSELGPLRAIDPTREGVDGGRLAEPLNEQVKRAVANLQKARLQLGLDGDRLVTDVIGKGLTLSKAADLRGLSTRSGREYLGRRFRECLDTLAIVFGCATPSNSQAAANHKLTPPQ